jgi:hypothetical protein
MIAATWQDIVDELVSTAGNLADLLVRLEPEAAERSMRAAGLEVYHAMRPDFGHELAEQITVAFAKAVAGQCAELQAARYRGLN